MGRVSLIRSPKGVFFAAMMSVPPLISLIRQTRRRLPQWSLLLVVLALAGCVTTREDDYVSDIIADALREAEVATPGNPAQSPDEDRAQNKATSLEVPVRSTVERNPAAISVAPSGIVSLAAPSATPDSGSESVPSFVVPSGRESSATTTAAAVAAAVLPTGGGTAAAVRTGADTTRILDAAAIPPDSVGATVTNVGRRHMVLLKPTVPTIQPNTVIWITVDEDPSLNGRYSVGSDGAIDFGYVGMVYVQDYAVEQAAVVIKNVLEGRYLNRATVKLRIAKASYDQVGLLGAISSPGDIRIGPGTAISLSDLLLRAGGFRDDKRNLWVKIVRGGMLSPFGPAADGESFPLSTPTGDWAIPNVFLRNNDLAYVYAQSAGSMVGPTTGVRTTGAGTTSGPKRVILLGEVPRRGVVEFAENEPCTLMYLLFKIGGLPRFAKASKITILRLDKDGREIKIVKNGESLMEHGDPDEDVALEPGDRVIVPARKFTFF